MELKKFENNITSQWGEDGVIEEIFNRIGEGNKTCVEFGAWDGKHMSNCWNLWHNKDWNSILIEGELDRLEDLKKDLVDFPKVTPVHRFIEIEGDNSLDSILDEVNQTELIDLISIDIDSDDLAILKYLKRKPRVIIIEYNPTIPPHIDLIQKKGEYIGSSISSTYSVAKEKGYRLAHLTFTNMILVSNEEWDKLNITEYDFFRDFHYDKLTYVINSYDGQTMLSQSATYNPYLPESVDSVKNYVKKRYGKKTPQTLPSFESNKNLIHCLITKK